MGVGALVHTLNPRYFATQLRDIVLAARDRVFFVDVHCCEELAAVQAALPAADRATLLVQGVLMDAGGESAAAAAEAAGLQGALRPFEPLASSGRAYEWFGGQPIDENAPAGLSFTSGTTGAPKGVVYTHRGNMLHTFQELAADNLAVAATDTVMCAAALYHANGWGLPFSCPLAGAALVLPGRDVSGPSLVGLVQQHGVTLMTGVPTLYLDILTHLQSRPSGDASHRPLSTLQRAIIAGAAPAASVIEAFASYGVRLVQAWGMTEMSPLGTVNTLKHGVAPASQKERTQLAMKAGRAFWINDMRIAAMDSSKELPRDGRSVGRLLVRGPAIVASYYKGESKAKDPRLDNILEDGQWFDTGDLGSIDEHGYLSIVDRNKDVIKSGGESISSIEVENVALGAKGVAEACCVAMPHVRYTERPLLVVVRKDGIQPPATAESVLATYAGKVPKWWIPDEVVFVDAIPRTATGKMNKLGLRAELKSGKHDAARKPKARL